MQYNRPIIYYVIFPIQNPLPIISLIKHNNDIICTGPTVGLSPGQTVTNLKLKHSVTLPQNNWFQPQEPSFVQNNNNEYTTSSGRQHSYPQSQNSFIQDNQPILPPPYNPPVYQYPDPTYTYSTERESIQRNNPTRPPQTPRPFSSNSQPSFTRTIPPVTSNYPKNNNNVVECGKRVVPIALAVGGNHTVRGQWPWIVAIHYRITVSASDFFCGGTLISSE